MTVYLDVGAKRIQAYLARTPRLKGRRGGSALLAHDLLADGTRTAWHPHAEVNDEGKRTDGVLSLRFVDDDVDQDVIDRVVAHTVAFLQRQAPGAEWEVRIRRAATYSAALAEWGKAEQSGKELLLTGPQRLIPVPPTVSEVPVVRFCQLCGCDPAVRTIRAEPGSTDEHAACADCTRRFVDGGHRTNGLQWRPEEWEEHLRHGLGAERALVDAVAQATGRRVPVTQTFEQLAKLGAGDANHLCTVFVDGNRFGQVFAGLKDSGVRLGDLSTELADAVHAAVAAATSAVLVESDDALPVVPHLIGGDDLLATVTADRAWAFVMAFLDDYHRRTEEFAREHGGDAPTASAGLVFAKTAVPFSTTLDLADTALRRAKTAHQALVPAVCWIDVTQDGPAMPEHRNAPALAMLLGARNVLDRLGEVPPSGRARLAEIAGAAADLDRGQLDAVADLAMRLDRFEALQPFLSPDPPLPLRDALVLERWW